MSPAEIAAIRQLLALRRARAIAGVWCDAGYLRVQHPDGRMLRAQNSRGYARVLAAAKMWIAGRKAAA